MAKENRDGAMIGLQGRWPTLENNAPSNPGIKHLVGVADLEGPFSIDWEQQRAAFGFSAKPSW
jgi:hypothetical protein